MDEQTFKHLTTWAINHRFHAFEVVGAIVRFLSRLDKEDADRLLENSSWSEIEELTYR